MRQARQVLFQALPECPLEPSLDRHRAWRRAISARWPGWWVRCSPAAEDLTERCLAAGDPMGAIWASRRGLAASPTYERLTKLLAEAHLSNGEGHAASQVIASYRASLERLGLGDPDPELEELA